jgi:hypothetical protein
VPSTRMVNVASSVASGLLLTVTATVGAPAVHAASPIVADGSGPTSGSISQPLSRIARPAAFQFRPFGRPGVMAG